VSIRFAGLERAAASLEEALDGLLAALAPRGGELASFPYADKVRILHACWPVSVAEADSICAALLRFGILRKAEADGRPEEELKREFVLLQQAFRAIRLVGVEPDEGFRTIAVHLCARLANAANEVLTPWAAERAARTG
jgi:hypothetical protein